MKTWDLVERVAQVASADSLGQQVLDAALAFARGHESALFQRNQERMSLLVSKGLSSNGLQRVQQAWTSRRESLLEGQALADTNRRGETWVLLPAVDRDRVIGLLYLATTEKRLDDIRDREGLVPFARMAARALAMPARPDTGDLRAYLERTPANDVHRDQLLALLDREEWTIARVARILGVTRMTVYNKMRRYGIPRNRILKTPSRQTV